MDKIITYGSSHFTRFAFGVAKPIYKFFGLHHVEKLNRFVLTTLHIILSEHYRLELSFKNFTAASKEYAQHWVVMESVKVTGGSRLVVKNKVGYVSPLSDQNLWQELHCYKLQEEAQMIFKLHYPEKRASFWQYSEPIALEGLCFSALSPFSQSWVHWLFEMMPQLLALRELADAENVKILIEPDAPTQILETISLFFPAKNIVEIPLREQALCDELLIYDNPEPSWSVLWTRKVENKANEHYHHNLDALKKIRREVYARFGITDVAPQKKLFIRRKAAFRFIHNEQELADLLVENQFMVIEPSGMSFREQVECFSDTKTIVAQAGAALANIMFMKPGSRVVCLAADSPFLNYSYFQDIADAFDVELHYVLGMVDDPTQYCHTQHLSITHPLNASFTIDKTMLAATLNHQAA